jgi:large subunit ribosomal protein L19
MDFGIELKLNPNIPPINPGDTVRVTSRAREGGGEHTQSFQGVVIRVRKGGAGASFTVRRVTHGVGVECTFPLYSPLLEKVEVLKRGRVRRAKLYYLRHLSPKKIQAKLKTKVGVEEKLRE